MADYVRLAVDAGAKIVGGCCGTSFAHLAAMRQALDAHRKSDAPDRRDDRRAHRPAAQQEQAAAKAAETSEARRERRRSRG